MEVKSSGFILKLNVTGESDVIVRFLLASGEKFSAFARSGLKSRKRFGGLLEPFLHVSLRARKSLRSDLAQLEELQLKSEFSNLRLSLETLTLAAHFNELVELCSHEGLENRPLFNLYGAALLALNQSDQSNFLKTAFEVKLLLIMGWLPQFQRCSICQNTERLFVQATEGLVTCGDCQMSPLPLSPQNILDLGVILENPIQALPLNESMSRSLGPISETLLKNHLGKHNFKSKSFMEQLK